MRTGEIHEVSNYNDDDSKYVVAPHVALSLPSLKELEEQFQKATKNMSEQDIFCIQRGLTPEGMLGNSATLMEARRILGKMRLRNNSSLEFDDSVDIIRGVANVNHDT